VSADERAAAGQDAVASEPDAVAGVESGGPPRRGAGRAVVLSALWVVVLLVLAALWVRSPFSGPGRMFLLWSAAAVPLTLWSWSRFRAWGVRQVPGSPGFLLGLALAWALLAAVSVSTIPAIMAMDGLILRRDVLRWTGKGLEWLPGLFGLGLSVAGLAASLEARYRLAHGDVASGEGGVESGSHHDAT